MVWAIVIILLVFTCLFGWLFNRLMRNDHDFLAIGSAIVAIIFGVCTVFSAINFIAYVDHIHAPQIRIERHIEERAVYGTMLAEIGTLLSQDVTASDTYFQIYDNVINFNQRVRECEKYMGTCWEGVLCDPSYAGLTTIPLN